MYEASMGEVRLVAFNFAPVGWALCNGQKLPIAQNQALFSLIGTTYGGDGVRDFALPDLRGRAPIHQGQGPGLSDYSMGQLGGVESVTLLGNQIPAHVHGVPAAGEMTTDRPVGAAPAIGGSYGPASNGAMKETLPTGNNQPHQNMQPYVAMNYVIALQGVYPSRS